MNRPALVQCGDIAGVCDNVNCFNSHRSFAYRASVRAASATTANQVSFHEDRVKAGSQIASEETERNSVLPFDRIKLGYGSTLSPAKGASFLRKATAGLPEKKG